VLMKVFMGLNYGFHGISLGFKGIWHDFTTWNMMISLGFHGMQRSDWSGPEGKQDFATCQNSIRYGE